MSRAQDRTTEITCLRKEICSLREKRRCLEEKYEICQLTSCNECYGRQRDQLACENQQLKCRTKDLEKEVCRVRAAVECLKQKLACLC